MKDTATALSDRDRRLLYQTVAFLTMMIVPGLLYLAAKAGANGWILILLGVMAASMVLAAWAS